MQTSSIIRWLFQKRGQYPTDPEALYRIEAAIDFKYDLIVSMYKALMTQGPEKERAVRHFLSEELPEAMAQLERFFVEGYEGKGYWVGDRLTPADVHFVDFATKVLYHHNHSPYGERALGRAPEFKRYVDGLIENVFKDYLAARKPRPFQNIYIWKTNIVFSSCMLCFFFLSCAFFVCVRGLCLSWRPTALSLSLFVKWL
eukprot:TRINITY_DN1400_c0_g1_i20.p1 TRINITY_DN1400_c0_g1~~TRINITY_DN1400_c0_g1_i20.p1  ORF type:complete len:200 (-),score=32.45 TRINITY_DN1400_c0_g1_i20:405-1004(-)